MSDQRPLVPARIPSQFHAGRPKWVQWIGRRIFIAMGWTLEGDMPKDESTMIMVVAPHTSNWDFVIGMTVALAIDLKAYWVAKKSMFKSGFKNLLKWLGGLPVDRKKPQILFRQVADIVRDNAGAMIVVTPEGTRSKVTKWKTGCLRMARQIECNIIMVGFDFAKKQVVFGEVFTPTGDDAEDILKIKEYFQRFTPKIKANF